MRCTTWASIRPQADRSPTWTPRPADGSAPSYATWTSGWAAPADSHSQLAQRPVRKPAHQPPSRLGLPPAAPVQPRDWLATESRGHGTSSTARTCPTPPPQPPTRLRNHRAPARRRPTTAQRHDPRRRSTDSALRPSPGRLRPSPGRQTPPNDDQGQPTAPDIEPAQSLDQVSELVGRRTSRPVRRILCPARP